MEHVAFPRLRPAAEIEEAPRHLMIAGVIHRHGNIGAVARPDIRIRIAVKPHDVAVVRSQNAAVVIGLCPDDEETALIEINEMRVERAISLMVFVDPALPVVAGAALHLFRGFFQYVIVEREDFLD